MQCFIGKPKVAAAGEQLARFNPGVTFEPVQRLIAGPHEICDLIKGVDLVVSCVDQPSEIMMWVNQAALEENISFIEGEYHGICAEIGPFVIPFETGCLACEMTASNADVGKMAEFDWIEQATWLRHPNIHFVTAMAANLICSEICKHLLGVGKPMTCNRRYLLNTQQFTLTSSEFLRSPACNQCGHGKNVSTYS
ncbi:TOMM precursor leader peptide-binding protein [Ktedonospora formicarum]|uniref:TOMM precursor leader peptide-binding protein n=1 Tax=Ktedonospora formicarum TaxID=2778364 RepID=UPI001C68B551|nr:TOMM precursor leader peptide-binding protein [Ktedonospora formicarum]